MNDDKSKLDPQITQISQISVMGVGKHWAIGTLCGFLAAAVV
jgi:hypothetical protein